jgi:hypothetical protein
LLQSILPGLSWYSFLGAHSRYWSAALNRASAALESIIAKSLHRSPADESALLAWTVACGSAVADRTRALSFSDGVLRVEVADRGWQRELTALAPRYVAAINRYAATSVRRIEFVVKT